MPGGSPLCSVLSVLVAAISAVLFGLALGFTSPAIDVMQGTVAVKVPNDLVVFKSKAEGSLFSSIINIGCLTGALLGGPLSERVGRKGALVLQGPLYAVVWAATSLAQSYSLLMASRFCLGICVGISSAVVPTYISEVSPTSLRGGLGAVFQVAIVFGIMLCYLLGAYVLVVPSEGLKICQWRWLSLFGVAMAAVLFCFALFIPESPRYLAWKNRPDAARKALASLRGGAEFIGEELDEIHAVVQQSSAKVACSDMLSYHKALTIGLTLMFIQQFSGVNAVIFFQDSIFMSAGLKDANGLGFWVMVIQLVLTIVSVPLMDTAGRKVLLVTACGGMMLCCLGLTIFFQFASSQGWLVLASSFGYIGFFSLGLGPIPWLMMGEVFPGKIRSSASSLAAASNWICSFITTETVSSLQSALGFSGVFALYAVFILLGMVFVLRAVPETKGRSFAEIEAMLAPRRRDVPLIPIA